MPITFGELVQEVINEVRERERVTVIAQQQATKIKELEGELVALKKANEKHICTVPPVNEKVAVSENVVREPDKPKLVPVVKEIK